MASAQWLALSVISLETASGMKPAEEVKVTMRRISRGEVMDIIHKFPEMVPSYLDYGRNDTELLTDVYSFSEVTAAPLKRVFPAARFYEYQGFNSPPYPYLMAVDGDKHYGMAKGFNYLLLDNGLEVTDKNIVELAKAFVITAIGSEHYSYPEITFLDATRTKLKADFQTDDAAILKVKIGAQVEEWHFNVLWKQFDGVSRTNQKGLVMDYYPIMVESLPGRSQPDPTPNAPKQLK
jgi:hypothetical protein